MMGRRRTGALCAAMSLFLALVGLPSVMGQAPAIPQCDGVTSDGKVANASNVCACKDGWMGPSCNICTDNGACRAMPGALKDMVCSKKSYTPIKDMYGMCGIDSEDIGKLIRGHGVINMHSSAGGNFSFDFIKVNSEKRWVPLFACNSYHTTIESDPSRGQIRFVAPDLACNLSCVVGTDRTCTPFLSNIIQQVGKKGGAIVTCEPGKARCLISESTLDTFLGGVSTNECVLSECAEAGAVGSASVVSFTVMSRMSSAQRGAIGIGSAYVIFSGLLLLVALVFWVATRNFGSYASAKATLAKMGPSSAMGAGGAHGSGGGAGGDHETFDVVWQDLTYAIGGKRILKGLTGLARPGELLAIMGPSGSGKTSLLDILARKSKSGSVGGRLLYNGESAEVEGVREKIGFVDQEDTLQGTMTVFESVLLSAVLRLPDDMSLADKATRVMRVLKDLRLTHVADSYVGSKSKRGISGGEKRRVMVAMELVKVPSVLLLDEPTSGLDAFNAGLLVECLQSLALSRRTTVLMTIHQPRSNIFSSFDRLLVINHGLATYHGPTSEVGPYFAAISRPIPAEYNPADFLIDVLFDKDITPPPSTSNNNHSFSPSPLSPSATAIEVGPSPLRGAHRDHGLDHDEELKDAGAPHNTTHSAGPYPAAAHHGGGDVELVQQSNQQATTSPSVLMGSPARQAVELVEMGGGEGPTPNKDNKDKEKEKDALQLSASNDPTAINSADGANPLALRFNDSDMARRVHEDVARTLSQYTPTPAKSDSPLPLARGPSPLNTTTIDTSSGSSHISRPLTQGTASSSSPLPLSPSPSPSARRLHCGNRGGGRGPTVGLCALMGQWARRFYVEVGMLSKRTLLGLVRNPLLLASHTTAAVYFAFVLGVVYYQLDMSSLGAIQNRLGAFLLSCVFLTFTSVSALPLFWLERSLYIHEYSNRFYSPAAYFITKVFFDLLLLRCVPALLFGAVTYAMVGYRPGAAHFVAYEALLVLLTCTAAMLNLFLGMLTKDIMSGILLATIVMIHFLMLTNLFINFGSMRLGWLRWLKEVSFINYAYEGLAQNELVGRRLYNFPISTGTGVLTELGFRTDTFYHDLLSLLIYLSVAIGLAFVTLRFAVKEKR